MQRIVLIYIILFSGLAVRAQDGTTFSYFDSLTYKQYTDGSWKELTQSGREALDLGYDYYYMRMRVGISYYERASYLKAIPHFKKALEFNNNDQVAIEYIYYCYLFSGKHYMASAYTQNFRTPLLEKTGVASAKKNRVSFDYLNNMSSSDEIVNEYLSINGLPDPGNHVIPLKYSNYSISMHHNIKAGTDISHSLSYLSRTNSLFISDGADYYPDYKQKVKQVQYFFSAAFTSTKGLSFTPSVYYLYTSYPLIEFSNYGMQNQAYLVSVSERNIGTGMALGLTAGLVDFTAGACYSRLGARNHFQTGGGLYFYPFANNSFYLGGEYSYKVSETANQYDKGTVLKAKTGFLFNNRFYLDLSLLSGDIENFVEGNGQVIYNGVNDIESIVKVDISVPVGSSGLIFYIGTRYITEYSAYIPTDYLYSTSANNKFKSFSIIGGLSWTF